MGKLIEEAAALAALHSIQYWNPEDHFRAEQAIQSCPAVDAVPVIRCRDCRRHKYGRFCDRTGVNAGPDDFCSYAELNGGK